MWTGGRRTRWGARKRGIRRRRCGNRLHIHRICLIPITEGKKVASPPIRRSAHQRANSVFVFDLHRRCDVFSIKLNQRYERCVFRSGERGVYVNSLSETSDGQICVHGDPKARPGLHCHGRIHCEFFGRDVRRRGSRRVRRRLRTRRWRTRMRRRGRAWRTRMRRWGRAWRRQRRVWREYGHVISSARPPFSLDNLDVRKGSNERSGR